MNIISLIKLSGAFNKYIKASFDDKVGCTYTGKVNSPNKDMTGKVFDFGDEEGIEVIKWEDGSYEGYMVRMKMLEDGKLDIKRINVDVDPDMIEAIEAEEMRMSKEEGKNDNYSSRSFDEDNEPCDHYWLARQGGTCPKCGETFKENFGYP